MKILTIVGARPQFIKVAVVSRAIAMYSQLNEIIVHTGQHFDHNMSSIFFEEMNIPKPQYNLGIGGGSHAENTGRAMELIEKVILHESPNLVMVYGDTDATLAGSIAAAKLCVPIAHVEAGLRSFNRKMPEEINRILTDHLSQILFAPSRLALANLEREGITGDRVIISGDVMYDAVKYYTKIAEANSNIIKRLNLRHKEYILFTLHRKENTDDINRLTSIIDAVSESNVPVVFPLHPRTKKQIFQFKINLGKNILLIDPVGYLDMQVLERHAKLIMTDSGGVQKEAYFHNVFCVTLRDETEWKELVDAGVNILVGANKERIIDAIKTEKTSNVPTDIYGIGRSSQTIAEYFLSMVTNVKP